ncbi:MAG: Gfo/Idh/MocA family oxidoreductase [Gemmatimonadaceae bacterium]|nr:Gfo/Idh/MocA family oxidoreductase [Gemmatimonadaceae bacterium]
MTVKPPLRVGVAGYGVVGRRRRQVVDANPLMKTVAVSDITFADAPLEDSAVYVESSWERLLDHELDVLIVSLPNHIAPDATIAGHEHGLHVFCEKPPGRSVADIRRVRAVEQAHPGQRLKYGFNHRYHDSVIETKRIIESGRYGRVINVRGVYGKSSIIPFSGGWRSERTVAGGGILLDQGIHMLDMIRYFCGDFDEVQSFVSNGYWKHDVEDNAYALMRSRHGVVAMIHSTATQWRHTFRLEVTLEEALLELTGILSGSKSYGEERLTVVPRKDGSAVGAHEETTTQYLDDHSWKDEIEEFADVLLTGAPVLHGTSYDAERVMELVFRIYHADSRWREAYDIPDPRVP